MTGTLDEQLTNGPTPHPHAGELTLRRLLAGESLGADHDDIVAHTEGCADCRRRRDGLADEQRAFEGRISFDRFSAGVERAARVPSPASALGSRRDRVSDRQHWWRRPASSKSFIAAMSVGAAAAVFALVIGVRPLFEAARLAQDRQQDRRQAGKVDRKVEHGTEQGAATGAETMNRIKGGGAEIVVRIARPNGSAQRAASGAGVERLAPGERIRLGVRPGAYRYVFVIAVDDRGAVTPVYPEVGTSLALPPNPSLLSYLPDSIELTGRGSERLVVVLTDEPLEFDVLERAAAAAFTDARGDLTRLPALAVRGEQFHRLFEKP